MKMVFPKIYRQDEVDAFLKVTKGRRINLLLGVGSGGNTLDCFALGFPDTMVLFDPCWANEDRMASELKFLEKIRDKRTKLDFKEDNSRFLKVEFLFDKKVKTVFYYKIKYDPGLLGKFKPDVFHMGHAVIGDSPGYVQFEPTVLETVFLLPKGTIILNIDGGPTRYSFSLLVYAHYFLDVVCTYEAESPVLGRHPVFIYRKTRDIDEKENVLVYKFVRALNELSHLLSNKGVYAQEGELIEKRKDMIVKLKQEALEKGVPYEEPRVVKRQRKYKKSLIELPKRLEALWSAFSPVQQKKLLNVISNLKSLHANVRYVEEALKIAGLR